MSATSANTDRSDGDSQSVRLLIHPETLSPGVFRATLMIDKNKNRGNFSMNDIAAAVIAFANSSGYSRIDCSLNQIACFVKDDIHLSLEYTDDPEITRIELVKDKTALENVADTAVQIFFEGLILHLQRPYGRADFIKP